MITLLENNSQTGFCKFFIDKETDITELPTHLHGGVSNYKNTVCSYGSIAECLDGNTYRLSSEDKWVLYKNPSNSGGGSSAGGDTPSGGEDDNIEPIPDDDINSLFNK